MVISRILTYSRILSLSRSLALGLAIGFSTFSPVAAKDTAPDIGKTEFGNYLAGRHAQLASNPSFAIEYYKSALRKSPGKVSLLRQITALLVSEGKIAEALIGAKRQLEISDKESNLSRLILALSEIKKQKYTKALDLLNQLPEGGLNAFSLPMLKAWVLAGQKKYDEALKILDQKTNNEGLEALFGIHGALISELSGNTKNAIVRYKKTVKIRKNANLRITILLGNLYERLGQTDNAKGVYDRYKLQRPESPMLDSTYKRLKSGNKPDSNNQNARDGAAEALFSLGFAIQNQNPFQTVMYSQLAVYLRPSLTIASLLLAESLDGNERLEDANKIYRKVSADPAYAWTARLRIANNLDRLGNTDDAVRELRAMSIENMKRFDALYRMGSILQRHKRYNEASKAFEEAKARIPNFTAKHWSLHYSLGISYERIKKWPIAEENFLKALELQPNHPSVLNYLAYSWVEQGLHLDRAQEMIRSAVKQRPRDGYIIDSLGWVLYRLGDLKGAVKQLERAVQIRPEDPTINDHLGDIYWAVGRKNEATFQWNRALTLEPEIDQIPKIELKLKSGLPENTNNRKGI
jgi:tetratricopeptide (TPR) repeat protein